MKNVYIVYTNKAGNEKAGQGLAEPYQSEAFVELINSSNTQSKHDKDGYKFELFLCTNNNVAKMVRNNGKIGGFLSNDLKKAETTWHLYDRIVLETEREILSSLEN